MMETPNRDCSSAVQHGRLFPSLSTEFLFNRKKLLFIEMQLREREEREEIDVA